MPAGRPTDYKPEYDELAFNYCKLGAQDKELAEFFKVTETTINNWKNEHPKFFESIKKGKDIYDTEEVEVSLKKRAKGYTRTVQKVTKDGDIIEIDEELPPDPTSMIFFLKNRKPDRWRDKQEHEHTGDINVNINLDPKIADKS